MLSPMPDPTIAPTDTPETEPEPPGRPRATGPPHDGAPIGIAIGVISALGYAGLAFALGFTFFAFVAIYALVKAVGDQGPGSAVVIMIGTVLLTTTFVLLLAVGVGMLGRSLSPKRRRR
jgi:hypothetical protein